MKLFHAADPFPVTENKHALIEPRYKFAYTDKNEDKKNDLESQDTG